LAIALLLVALPASASLAHALRELLSPVSRPALLAALAPSPKLLALSLAWAGAIALIACILAWPAALAARASGWLAGAHAWRIAALLAAPLLMPNYLAFHALGILRDPTYALGSAIVRAGEHWRDLPLLVGQGLALLGLALWAWPLACLVLASALARVEDSALEHLRLDGAPWLSRQRAILSMCRHAMLRAWGLVLLVMLGSAVPLHLAQTPTYAALTWQEVTLHPTSARALFASWPTLAIAGLAASVCARRWSDDQLPAEPSAPRSLAPWPLVLLACLSTLLPVALEASTLRSLDALPAFWRVSAPALAQSLLLAACVGALAALIALLAMRRGRVTSWPLRLALALLFLGALAPGLTVGHAWALAARSIDPTILVFLAHASRFGALAAIAGLWLARSEPLSLADLRSLDAGERGSRALRAWWVATASPRLGPLAAIALACACLGLHEIEAAIVLQSPGLRSLAQTILAQLHFARQEDLAAATIMVVGPALLASILAGALFARRPIADRSLPNR
jgi:ABC-type Fe3+ transport system permease subunit